MQAVTVLAGDPCQLGPVLQSHLAADCGLQTSMLERIILRPLYARDETHFADHGCYDPLLVGGKLLGNLCKLMCFVPTDHKVVGFFLFNTGKLVILLGMLLFAF